VVEKKNAELAFKVTSWSAWSPRFSEKGDWSAWAQGENTENPLAAGEQIAPSMSFLPIAMRKKLSKLCKLVLYLSNDILKDAGDIPIVMASRFGESALTLELLEAVGKDEQLSPMVFSRSVMNSSVGLYSIFAKNKAPSVCISAMEDSFASGLLEAQMRLHTRKGPVLFLYVEEEVIDVFRPYVQDPPVSYGAGFLLEPSESVRYQSATCLDLLREVAAGAPA
jgi:hypothetical protein